MEPGEVVTYQLTPEELEKYKKGDVKPMAAAAKKLTKEDLTKEVYLKLVKQGKIDAHIRKEYGISNWTTLKRMKDAWGITGDGRASQTVTDSTLPAGVSLEQIMDKLNIIATEQAETKKQLNGICEILTQLTQKNNSPNDQYIQNRDEKSNNDQTVDLIRALLKELL